MLITVLPQHSDLYENIHTFELHGALLPILKVQCVISMQLILAKSMAKRGFSIDQYFNSTTMFTIFREINLNNLK